MAAPGIMPVLPDSGAHLLEALALLGGEASPADLSRVAGLAPRTVTKHLERLRSAGLVGGSTRLPRLTALGRASALPPAPVAQGSWDQVIGDLWPPWWAALVRLIADAVVARHLAPERRGHPGFIAYGPPHTFKTAVAEFICAMFALDAGTTVALAPRLAPGEVVGRRRPGPGGFEFEAVPRTRAPFACLDELADAEPEVRRAAMAYLHGETTLEVEGTPVDLAPVVLVCFNPPERSADQVLPAAIWRRCLRLRTDDLPVPSDQARRLDAFTKGPKPAPVGLACLRLPAPGLPDSSWALIDGDGSRGFYGVLTERGRTWHDRRSLETLALGRAARLGAELGLSTVAMILDVLTLAETVPDLVACVDWRPNVDALRSAGAGHPGARETADAYDALVAKRSQAREAVAARRRQDEAVDLDLLGRRQALMETYAQAARSIERVPAPVREQAAGLRAQLRDLRTRAGDARRAARLDELEALGTRYLAAAHDLRRGLQAEAEQRRRALDQARAALAGLGRLGPAQRAERDRLREALAQAKQADRGAFEALLDRVADGTRSLADRVDQDRRQVRLAKGSAERQRAVERAQAARRRHLEALRRRRRTKPGEDVTGALEAAGAVRRVVDEVQESVEPSPASKLGALLVGRPAPAPTWRTVPRTYFVDAAGRSWWPEKLQAWGSPGVDAVIDAALAGRAPALAPARELLALSPPS